MQSTHVLEGVLWRIANDSGIEGVMEAVFGFLAQRTDFYEDPESGRRVLLEAYETGLSKYRKAKAEKDAEEKRRQDAKRRAESGPKIDIESTMTPDQLHLYRTRKAAAEALRAKGAKAAAEAAKLKAFHEEQARLEKEPRFEIIEEESESPPPSPPPKEASASPAEVATSKVETEATSVPSVAGTTETAQADAEGKYPPGPGNGFKTDRYSWTQTLTAVEVNVNSTERFTGKDCKITIKPNHLSVAIKGVKVLGGNLPGRVDTDESFWSIVDGKTLQLNLEKSDGMGWWECVVEGEPKIDVQKVEPENASLSDLDPETRRTVEKMMYDQRQRSMGLPTSADQEQARLLDNFKAQHPEFDFSELQQTSTRK